jgi:hypothetical protein
LYGLAVGGDHAFVAVLDDGMRVVEITDPEAPVLVGGLDTDGLALDIAVSQNYVYLADSSAVHVVDVAVPAAPVLAGSYESVRYAFGVAHLGDFAYVADGYDGLITLSVSDPTQPMLIRGLDIADAPRVITVAGDYAYHADGLSGLQIFRISEPALPTLTGSCNTPGFARDVDVANGFAFVADGDSGLVIIDVTDPTPPEIIGRYESGIRVVSVAAQGEYAYVATHTECAGLPSCLGALEVVHVGDPHNPVRAFGPIPMLEPVDVEISGDRVYVAWTSDSQGGFLILDISDPMNPRTLGGSPTSAWVFDLAVAAPFAYLAEVIAVEVFDVSDPASTHLAGGFSPPGSALALAVRGGYAYVTTFALGLQVWNVADAAQPYQAASFAALETAIQQCAVAGDYAYVVNEAGFLVLSLDFGYQRGDANGDQSIAAMDLVYLIRYLFKGGDPPHPYLLAGDANCDGMVSMADVIYLVSYVYRSGIPPGCGTAG